MTFPTKAICNYNLRYRSNRAEETESCLVSAKDFIFIRHLGEGGFAVVYLVLKRGGIDDGTLYAMKVMQKSNIIHNEVTEHVMMERRVFGKIDNSPFLVKLQYAFQTESRLFLVMDYFPGGDMRQYISRQGKLTEVEVKYYLAEIILAIQHLHEMQIIHRDLKPENLLLDSSGHIAVADYGLCKFLSRNKAYSFCGTEGYLAPEMFSGRGYSKAVDWWSIGILTYEMLTGSMPFTVVNQKDMTKPHFRVRYRTPVMPKHFSPEVVDFITRLLDEDPRKRLGGGKDDIWKVKRHPFLCDINWADVARKATVMPRVPRLNEVRVGTVQKHCTMDIFLQPSITLLCKGDTTIRGYSFMSQALIPNRNSTSGTYQKCPNMVKLTPKRRALQVTTKRGHHTPHINVMKKPKRQARTALRRQHLEENFSGPSTSKTVVKKDVNRMECKRKLERDSEESVIPFKKFRIDKPSHRMTTESECTPQINMFIAPEMPARGGVQLTTDRRRLTSRTNVSRIPETRARTALHRQHLEENFSGPSTSKTVLKKDVNRMARKRKLRRQPFKRR